MSSIDATRWNSQPLWNYTEFEGVLWLKLYNYFLFKTGTISLQDKSYEGPNLTLCADRDFTPLQLFQAGFGAQPAS